MKASQVYDRYITKTEKNSVNDGLSTDKQRFIEIYNEYQIRYFEYIKGLGSDDLDYIESLSVKHKKLTKYIKERGHYSFELPKNYLSLSSAYALGSKGDCLGQKIDLPVKAEDAERTIFMNDENINPSFEYRESFYTLSSGSFNVFYTDFTVDSLILSYYRYPRKLTLTDPNNPESDFDDSLNVDFDEKSINKIISAAASGFDINNNSERWQINNVFSKKDL